MLSLEHFCVAREKEVIHVKDTGEESVSVPVYFHNHGEPKMIGSISKKSLGIFDSFVPAKKLEILCNMLDLAEK